MEPEERDQDVAPGTQRDGVGVQPVVRAGARAPVERLVQRSARFTRLHALLERDDRTALSDGEVPLAIRDEPELQRQSVHAVDLDGSGSFIVYGTGGSGKTTLLRTFALSLASKLAPDDVHLYGVDFGRGRETFAGQRFVIGRKHIDGGAQITRWLRFGGAFQSGPGIFYDQANPFGGTSAYRNMNVNWQPNSKLSHNVGYTFVTFDRATGEIHYGRVPAYSVVVSGILQAAKPLPDGSPGPGLYCAVIVKRVDEKTRAKTSINELLRD